MINRINIQFINLDIYVFMRAEGIENNRIIDKSGKRFCLNQIRLLESK